MKAHISRTLVVLLALSLVGTTELAQACQSATQEPQSQTQTTTTTPAQDAKTPDTTTTQDTAKPDNNASDPSYVPAPSAVLPNAPSSTETQSASSTSNSNQTKDQQPLGAAAAEKGTTTGGAASKPAGTALAGTKQNQSRGLLIKVGAVLAAGAALGTVYALSRGTSPTPPGAVR